MRLITPMLDYLRRLREANKQKDKLIEELDRQRSLCKRRSPNWRAKRKKRNKAAKLSRRRNRA